MVAIFCMNPGYPWDKDFKQLMHNQCIINSFSYCIQQRRTLAMHSKVGGEKHFCNQFINLTYRLGFISLGNVIHFLRKVFIAVCESKTDIKYLQETMTTYIMYLTLLATTYLHLSLSQHPCLITPPCPTHSPSLQQLLLVSRQNRSVRFV